MQRYGENGGQAYTHNGDWKLMRQLGLDTNFNRDWTDVGIVDMGVLRDEQLGERTIKVEVCALPAQFFRFTITRPVDNDDPEREYETFVVTTASGGFGEFWTVARMLAQDTIRIVQKEEEE